jgi:hypothetical protein
MRGMPIDMPRGALNAIGRRRVGGIKRIRRCEMLRRWRGQNRIQSLSRRRSESSAPRTKSGLQNNIGAGSKGISISCESLRRRENPQSSMQFRNGRIFQKSTEFMQKLCSCRKRPGNSNTSIILCHCNTRSFAVCIPSRIFRFLMLQLTAPRKITIGLICLNDQAQRQMRICP